MMTNNTSLNCIVSPVAQVQSLSFILFWLSVLHIFPIGCGRECDESDHEVGHLPLFHDSHPTDDEKPLYPQDRNKPFLPLQRQRIIAEPLLPYPDKIKDFE